MKLVYVCECCDTVMHSLEVEALSQEEITAALTGTDSRHIIDISGSGDQVTLTTLCQDCLEDMYGRSEISILSGPVLN